MSEGDTEKVDFRWPCIPHTATFLEHVKLCVESLDMARNGDRWDKGSW